MYWERAVFVETGQDFVKGRSWEEMKIRIAFFLVDSPTSCEELVVVKVGDRNFKTLFVQATLTLRSIFVPIGRQLPVN